MTVKFDPDDVAPKPHSRELTDAILDVILSWPRLEMGLTYWISFAISLRPSETGILLGAMDTKSKINKLKSLYVHRGDKEAAALLKDMSKEHRDFSEIRNTIAHAMLLGGSKSDPNDAYFQTTLAVSDQHGFMTIKRFSIANLRETAEFAMGRSVDILDLLTRRGAKLDQ